MILDDWRVFGIKTTAVTTRRKCCLLNHQHKWSPIPMRPTTRCTLTAGVEWTQYSRTCSSLTQEWVWNSERTNRSACTQTRCMLWARRDRSDSPHKTDIIEAFSAAVYPPLC